jgi:hypothetical protein
MSDDRVLRELEERRREGAVLRRIGGLKGMAAALTGGGVPRTLRTFIEDAFAVDVNARPWRVSQKSCELGPMLRGISEAEWERLVGTLLPQLAPSAHSAWRALARRPFQEGTMRRPFRAPHSAATQAEVRGRWLLSVTLLLGEYEEDIRWVAERGAHLAGWTGGAELGWLLAGAIDLGGETGDAVLSILQASALGEHETGRMGRHVTQALMSCERPEAWEFIERLLLAAQRQEGLRQAILEAVDEAHPECFRRMLRLIREHDLSRFSSLVRAADTWFGFAWDGASGLKLSEVLERVLLYLEDPAARDAALAGEDAEAAYLALWCIAFEDVEAAITPAAALLAAESAELRFAGAHLLAQSRWPAALPPLVEALADADLRVAARALDAFGGNATRQVDGALLFERLEGLMSADAEALPHAGGDRLALVEAQAGEAGDRRGDVRQRLRRAGGAAAPLRGRPRPRAARVVHPPHRGATAALERAAGDAAEGEAERAGARGGARAAGRFLGGCARRGFRGDGPPAAAR